MQHLLATDPLFLETLRAWIADGSEVLLMIRHSHMGGAKDFEFVSSFDEASGVIRSLSARTGIVAFREKQLPLRGIVDDGFIDKCLAAIPDGAEYLLVERCCRFAGRGHWVVDRAGESHLELREDLEDARGISVAVGLYPPFLDENEFVMRAYIPNADGRFEPGAY